MSQLTQSLLEALLDPENFAHAVQILFWAGLYAVIITVSLVVLREQALWRLHHRVRGTGGLWRIRLIEETYITLNDWIAWLTPAGAIGSTDTGTQYDRACAWTPWSIARAVAAAPAGLLRPTPFKILVTLVTLTVFAPGWTGVLYRRLLPYALALPAYVQSVDLLGPVTKLQAGAALLACALFGGTFAMHRASRSRRAGKLEQALEYNDRMTDALEEILRVARKNISTLHARAGDLPTYFPPSESDTQQRWYNPMLFGRNDFSAHFDSFGEEAEKVADLLRRIEEENLRGEYYEINRRASGELLWLGLFSSDSAVRLTRKLLDASHVKEVCDDWLSRLGPRPEAERNEEIKKWARGLLTDAIEHEVRLTRLLWRTRRVGVLRRILFGIGTLND